MSTDNGVPKENTKEAAFDAVIQLVSECVVIRASMQQHIERLFDVDGKKKNTIESLQDMLSFIEKEKKAHAHDEQAKELDSLQGKVTQSYEQMQNDGVHGSLVGLDETISRFGKVLGELQGHLMKIDLGKSTMAIKQALLATIGDEVVAFPLEIVDEILKVTEAETFSVDGNETITLRGHALGVIELSTVLGLSAVTKPADSEHSEKRIVVISDGTTKLGVVVGDLLGEDDIVFKELPRHMRDIRGVCGASILGDGRVAIIIDAGETISAASS